MKRLIVVCAALLLWAGSANAKDIAGVIKAVVDNDRLGACNVGYSQYCPSHQCECFTLHGDASGSLGRGPVDLFVTVDRGARLSPEGGPSCYPMFMSAEISASHGPATMSIVGAGCAPQSGETVKITGGFGIKSSEVQGFGWGGWGSVSGSANPSTGLAVVRYVGFGFGF